MVAAGSALWGQNRVGRYERFEVSFEASKSYSNPYVDVVADADITRPDGTAARIPLFWFGGRTFKLRLSPDVTGVWSFRVTANDAGLNGKSGRFECVPSPEAGGLQASKTAPGHFARQNGTPVWFMGDTAWAYFTDSSEDNHHRPQAEYYAKKRASQGFNVIHSMLLSEQGVGNQNGLPFEQIGAERINPAYWREVDERLAFANRQGLTVGLALAWGDKRKVEPFAWSRFPGLEARRRYARYIAARYSAFDVYFLVSGEWNAEARTRANTTEDQLFREFVSIGDALAAADPHHRMIGIHPMARHGSVREFASARWMSFADYQQNYRDLHGRVLLSRYLPGPVVNGEYGYHLRDADGDGRPDKSNSRSAAEMRFASWDIAMAGGYVVTGFGTTYFGGHRDPGPFDVDAPKNRDWEEQIGHLRKFFTSLEWWKFIPADSLVSSPPKTTCWAMAIPGEAYIVYLRGARLPVSLEPGARARAYSIRQFNPRTGEFISLAGARVSTRYEYRAPDEQDWVVLLQAR